METHKANGYLVELSYPFPPIPSRAFDVCATFDGYDAGDPIGFGPTEEAAIADLFDAAETVDWFADRPPMSEAQLDAEIARKEALRRRLEALR